MTSLTYAELERQLLDCHLGLVELSLVPKLREVRIRTAEGDSYLAAIHREGDVLIFDLGQKVEAL